MSDYHEFAQTVFEGIKKDKTFYDVSLRTVDLGWIENDDIDAFKKNPVHTTREFIEVNAKDWKFKPCVDLQYAFMDRNKYSMQTLIDAVKLAVEREINQYRRIENELGHTVPELSRSVEGLQTETEQEQFEMEK